MFRASDDRSNKYDCDYDVCAKADLTVHQLRSRNAILEIQRGGEDDTVGSLQ